MDFSFHASFSEAGAFGVENRVRADGEVPDSSHTKTRSLIRKRGLSYENAVGWRAREPRFTYEPRKGGCPALFDFDFKKGVGSPEISNAATQQQQRRQPTKHCCSFGSSLLLVNDNADDIRWITSATVSITPSTNRSLPYSILAFSSKFTLNQQTVNDGSHEINYT